jgi:hypothetical protein
VFGQIQIVDKISANRLKLIPDVYIGASGAGANGQGGEHNGLMSLALLQYLTGRSVVAPANPSGAHEPSE